MLRSCFCRSKTAIGLDIQSEEIRLLQLRYSNHHISVKQAAVMALPQGAIVDGHIEQAEVVSRCLKTLIKNTQTTGHAATIALPAHCVISNKLQMPSDLKALEREAEIEDNLEMNFPDLPDELMYDYVVLSTNKTNTENVLLVAARYEQLISFINLVEGAGLKLKCIDVDVYALTRAVEFAIDRVNTLQMILFADMNDPIAQVIIAYKNEIVFHRQLINKSILEIGHEIKHGLQLCDKNFADVKIQKIYLSGFVSVLPDSINKELAIETEYINPFEKMSYLKEFSTISKKMLLSCGLALRGGRND